MLAHQRAPLSRCPGLRAGPHVALASPRARRFRLCRLRRRVSHPALAPRAVGDQHRQRVSREVRGRARRRSCSNRTATSAASSPSRCGAGTQAPRRWPRACASSTRAHHALHGEGPVGRAARRALLQLGVAAAHRRRRAQGPDRCRVQAAAGARHRRLPAGARARASAAIRSRTRASCSR